MSTQILVFKETQRRSVRKRSFNNEANMIWTQQSMDVVLKKYLPQIHTRSKFNMIVASLYY